MLAIHHISKSYNLNTILTDVSFTVKAGQRLGLVVTHDRYFIESFARQVWQVLDGTIRVHTIQKN